MGVLASIVVSRPSSIPNVWSSTSAMGVAQFVVQEALDTMWCDAAS